MISKIVALVKKFWWVIILVGFGVFVVWLIFRWNNLPYGWTWLDKYEFRGMG